MYSLIPSSGSLKSSGTTSRPAYSPAFGMPATGGLRARRLAGKNERNDELRYGLVILRDNDPFAHGQSMDQVGQRGLELPGV